MNCFTGSKLFSIVFLFFFDNIPGPSRQAEAELFRLFLFGVLFLYSGQGVLGCQRCVVVAKIFWNGFQKLVAFFLMLLDAVCCFFSLLAAVVDNSLTQHLRHFAAQGTKRGFWASSTLGEDNFKRFVFGALLACSDYLHMTSIGLQTNYLGKTTL